MIIEGITLDTVYDENRFTYKTVLTWNYRDETLKKLGLTPDEAKQEFEKYSSSVFKFYRDEFEESIKNPR